MKIYLMTDLEGVAGVLDSENWCHPESRYYEIAKEFLSLEASAAAEGFFAAGADEVLIVDGHGAGGLDIKLLDPRVSILRGWGPGPYPLCIDQSVDFVACVGQHAKAGSTFAHIAHTGTMAVRDLSINGVSIGEFGEIVLCASELGIRTIFAAGDEAFGLEASAFVPGIETVCVKRGLNPDPGDGCSREEYGKLNCDAIHLHPVEARKRIRKGAERALARAKEEKTFGIRTLTPPFEKVTALRASAMGPGSISRVMHPSSVAGVLNLW